MRNTWVLPIAVSIQATAGLAQDSLTWSDDVRGWYIGVDTSIGNGCYMHADYDGGAVLRVGFNPERDNLYFFVGNDDWLSIENGKIYPLSVEFGNQGAWTGDAEGQWIADLPMIRLDVDFDGGNAEDFIDEFMRQNHVAIHYDGRELAALRLSGTFAAMQETINCQAAYTSGGSGGNDPFR